VTTLPRSLVRFEAQLEQAIARDLRRSPVRIGARVAGAAGGLGALAFAAVALVPGGGPNVVQRAAAAVRVDDRSVVHEILNGDESWLTAGKVRTNFANGMESSTTATSGAIYDPRTNTLYTGGTGTGDLTEITITDVVDAFIASGFHQEDVTVDGRAAIRISNPDEYLIVDAQTYDPIAWSSTIDGVTQSGAWSLFERLPRTDSVFDLSAAHPGATVDSSPSDYASEVPLLTR